MKESWIDVESGLLPKPDKLVWVAVGDHVLLGRYSLADPVGWCHEFAMSYFYVKNRGVTHWMKAEIPKSPNV